MDAGRRSRLRWVWVLASLWIVSFAALVIVSTNGSLPPPPVNSSVHRDYPRAAPTSNTLQVLVGAVPLFTCVTSFFSLIATIFFNWRADRRAMLEMQMKLERQEVELARMREQLPR